MKYLLSWVTQHLAINTWTDIDTVENIIKKIETHISEVAEWQEINFSKANLKLATLVDETEDFCLARDNNEKIISLPPRAHAIIGGLYLVVEEEKKCRFANMKDLYSETKNHLIPPINGNIEDALYQLKEIKKKIDFSIKIDTAAIGNRPDLFSHRGLARELSTIYKIPLRNEKEIIYKKEYNKAKNLFSIETDNIIGVTGFSAQCHERETFLSYLPFLCPVDITPHSYLIDLSNYVMFDIGQPLHIFDRQKIKEKIRFQTNIEKKMRCLDNTEIQITSQDVVVTEKNSPLSLVGIIGGLDTSITPKTKEILVESAAINKDCVTNSIKHHQKKTESAIRSQRQTFYEGTLLAIGRFINLLEKDNISFQIHFIESYKSNIEEKKLIISSKYISNVIGNHVSDTTIDNIFIDLEYYIEKKINNKEETIFEVVIPWFRADINHKSDIVEDIARHIGYDNIDCIALLMPQQEYEKKKNLLTLKKNIVLLTHAHEIISYGINNEDTSNKYFFSSFLEKISLANIYSDKQKHLITSTIPNLLTIIIEKIKQKETDITIFEINPLWEKEDTFNENIFLSICFYKKKNNYNFYEYASIIKNIFKSIGYNINFKSILDEKEKRHNLYTNIAAKISYHHTSIGIAGFIDRLKIYREFKKEGECFSAEINLTKLFSQTKVIFHEKEYPFFDVSFLLKKIKKVDTVIQQVKIAFGEIVEIICIDWFEQSEWESLRSVTIRVYTMNEDLKELEKSVKEYLEKRSIEIR